MLQPQVILTPFPAGLPPAALDVLVEEEEECHGQGGRRIRPRGRQQRRQPLLYLRRRHPQANELARHHYC